MSDLPEIIQRMHDIQLPAEPGWWPPAPGWWGLALLVAIVGAVAVWLWRYRFAVRREALRELSRIERDFRRHKDGVALTAALSSLLRRVALARDGRRAVARLHGEAWLAYLDRRAGDDAFTAGPGRVLATLHFAGSGDGGVDGAALLRLVRRWIRSVGR